ncbi:MAG: heme ABC transporter ATP-binding protein, partial [Peptostreptococcaceae bacterium]|nr:heme ABC transporter ATP-binding protein [Peptostreptococcaceae bacterium]
GLAHIPEDRQKDGLILDYSMSQNLIMKKYFTPQFENRGLIKFNEINEFSEDLVEKFDIRSGQGINTSMRSMSGGNQQKVIIAREIDVDPEILIAVQPTRGLDVGAIEYINNQLISIRDEGKAILLISLELDEVMNISDRILVIYEGEIVANVKPEEVTIQELGLYMAGSKRSEVAV